MESKTKTFLWGTVVGVALLLVAITGLLTYLYYKGAEIRTEASAQKQKDVAEQIQRFGSTCTNAIPEATAYLFKTLEPALNAMQDGRFKKEQLSALTSGIKNQQEFLGHCSGKVFSVRDESTLKLSKRLMNASTEFASVYVYFDAMQLSACDPMCQQGFVRRATEASGKLEILLRGNES
jgi:hypothetical protein